MSSAAARTAFVTSFQAFTAPVSKAEFVAANDVASKPVRKIKPSRLFRDLQNSAPQTMKILPFWRP